MEVRALSWNLFHGRDAPPEPELMTWRSRILRMTERGAAHAQVNRDLYESFAQVLREADWDVALLQECPPRWAERLATDCRAEPHLVLTSRNIPWISPLQAIAADANPDLIASWGGGSNLTLVRSRRLDRPAISERRMLPLRRRPERRVMAFSRLAAGFCVANLHASNRPSMAERDVPLAAQVAREWAENEPLLLGGDFNIRPARNERVFAALERDHGLVVPTAPDAIDHLLVGGLEILDPPRRWPAQARELPDPTATRSAASLPIRLSDHAPVEAVFAHPPGPGADLS